MIKINPQKNYEILLVNCKSLFLNESAIFLLSYLDSIKNALPYANVSFLIHSSMSDFFANNPFIKEIFCIDEKEVLKKIKDAKIDISISIESSKASTILLFKAGIKTRIGYFSKLYSILFNYKIKKRRTDCNAHEIFSATSLLKIFKINEINAPKIYLSINEKALSLQFLESKFSDFSNLIVLIPLPQNEISYNFKNFLELANALASEFPLLIAGSFNEINFCKNMLHLHNNLSENNLFMFDKNDNSSPNMPHIDSKDSKSVSQTRLLLAILSNARLVIANNNAFLHAASALKSSTLGIFPCIKSINPNKNAPLGKNNLVLTPLGIYDKKSPLDASNPATQAQGIRINEIPTDLIIEIVKNKIL